MKKITSFGPVTSLVTTMKKGTTMNTHLVRIFVTAGGLALSGASLTACTAPTAGHPSNDGEIGAAVAAVATVPSGVQCIQLVLTGTVSDTIQAEITRGDPSTDVSLGQLPAGDLTVMALAYNVACRAVGSSTEASWASAPITVPITPGLTTPISLTLAKAAPVNGWASSIPKVQAIGSERMRRPCPPTALCSPEE
jgi:hypothetical protein